MRVFVGTSGWQYRHWRGRFYPPDGPTSAWLRLYAERFRTVEVNTSFYRLPAQESVRRWASLVPDDFTFAFKANRYLTHIRRMRDCDEPLRTMVKAFAIAGEKRGPVLFQLPPTLEADRALLERFIRAIPRGLRAAFEFRHPSWFTADVIGLLDAAGAALVHADRPGVRPDTLPIAGGWSYLRFHQGRRTTPGYARRKLRSYADTLSDLGEGDVFAYFNNDTDAAAVRDARTLQDLLTDLGIDAARPARLPVDPSG